MILPSKYFVGFASGLKLKLVLAGCITCVAFMLTACVEDAYDGTSNYDVQEVLDWRLDKDEAFKDATQSPLPEGLIERFMGLNYYEPDEDFAAEATLERNAEPDTITIRTTTDELRRAEVVGNLKFEMNGLKLSLVAYSFVGGNRDELFVPFKDGTNGNTTYGGGRYLSIPVASNDGEYVVDFNMAYSPYCAYNKAFSCPLVPSANILKVDVEAGEKK
ncbi:MAG: DUF1684 domain-containing protein [Ignavibacteria bacterium]|nr:DUF1684 domain-containing protein [Ignavibacteria bacterium]